MSDWFNGWTLSGGAITLLTTLLTIWRKSRPAGPSSSPSAGRKLAQWASAIGRLQIAEGDLDYLKQSRMFSFSEITRLEAEKANLVKELDGVRQELRACLDSAQTDGSQPSSAGSTKRPGVRRLKKPTT